MTMKETQRIVDQLDRAYEGDAWHGPSLKKILSGVTAAPAARRPLAQGHSIWELVRHIAVWDDVVRRRVEGERVGELPPEQDWPPPGEATDAAWKKELEELERGHRALRRAIEHFPDERLGETVPGMNYSFYVMLHGVVQHDLYHAGQIAILKRGFD